MYALSTTPSHSPSIWGAGDVSKSFIHFPVNENSWHLKFYYLLGFGYHLQNTVSHFITNPHETYYEMLLHHIATMMLIIFSYLTGLTHSGIYVLFLMDSGDALVGLIWILLDVAHKLVVCVVYFALMYFWIYYWLYIFYHEVFLIAFLGEKAWTGTNSYLYSVETSILSPLFLLNIYWGVLLLNMGLGFITKGK